MGSAPGVSSGAVLFDIDGTLVDSNYLHVTAWLEAFRAVGAQVATAAIHRCIGMGSPQLLDALLGDDAGRLGPPAKEEHSRRYAAARPHLAPLPGATELVRAVSARATAVLATSAPEGELQALREVLQLDDALDVVTSSEDVESAKPDPDIVQVALRRAGNEPGRAVFVGDTVWDVQAAGAAGVACVALRTGGIGEAELRGAGAVAVYDDAAALLADLDRSPLAAVLDP